MPIYVYDCNECKVGQEVRQPLGTDHLNCSCGRAMSKMPTCQALVLQKGAPSFRKRYLGTAPYTTRVTSSEKQKGGPGAKGPESEKQGAAWLESLA